MAFDIITDNYKNMVVASGRYWRQLRKLCTSELLTAKRLATYETARAEEIHNMMKELVEDAREGRAVNLKSWLQGITANNMTRMLTNKRYFGKGVESKKEKEDFDVMVARTFDLLGAFIISDFVPYLKFVTKLQGWQKKLEDYVATKVTTTTGLVPLDNDACILLTISIATKLQRDCTHKSLPQPHRQFFYSVLSR